MEGAGVCPAVAMAMIAEGKEQVIRLDHRTILQKIMESIGSPTPPHYATYDCGDNGERVSIKLNVSTARCYTGHHKMTVDIEGDISQTKLQAEQSAVMKAIKYLEDKHLIKIRDYSSRVMTDLDDNSAFVSVNDAMYNVDKMLDKWQLVMATFESIAVQLEEMEMTAKRDGNPAGEMDIYGSVNESIKMMIGMCKPRLTQARASANELECERKKYHSRSTSKYQSQLIKGYVQDAFLRVKDVLAYVLQYIGAGKPKFSNGPDESRNMMEGVVKFHIPDVKGLEICGKIKITGKSTRSRDAEEDAAYRALVYMEKNFHLRVADLNYAEREEAEKEEKKLVHLLGRIVSVGFDVKSYWGNLQETIKSELQRFTLVASNNYAPPNEATKKAAYKFCIKCLRELEQKTTQNYQECGFRFDDITQLAYRQHDLKTMFNMD